MDTIKEQQTRESVYTLIDGERHYQDQKWGDLDARNSVGDFLNYLGVELDNARKAYHGPDAPQAALEHVRKLAGVAVACMEAHETQPRRLE